MSVDDDKGRENWHRITLRLPPSLHQRLVEGAGNLSLNASIVQRLEDSFADNSEMLKSYEDVRAAVSKELREELKRALAETLHPNHDDQRIDTLRRNPGAVEDH